MNKKDQQFFDEHWKEWIERNPPSDYWIITKNSPEEWAKLEMTCRGFLGKVFFGIERWLSKKK